MQQYTRCEWNRLTSDTITRNEESIVELERKNVELRAKLNGFAMTPNQMPELMRGVEKLESQQQI